MRESVQTIIFRVVNYYNSRRIYNTNNGFSSLCYRVQLATLSQHKNDPI